MYIWNHVVLNSKSLRVDGEAAAYLKHQMFISSEMIYLIRFPRNERRRNIIYNENRELVSDPVIRNTKLSYIDLTLFV